MFLGPQVKSIEVIQSDLLKVFIITFNDQNKAPELYSYKGKYWIVQLH